MSGPVQPQVPPTLVRLAFMLRATRAPLTQEAFARKMGCSGRTVMRAERGDRLPTATLINLWLASSEAPEEQRAAVRRLYAEACEEARHTRTATARPVPTATLEEFLPGRTESEEADMHRAAVLKGMVAGGAALLLGRSSPLVAAPVVAADESVAESLKTVTGQYRRLEAMMPVADLFTPVRSHLRLINRTLAHWPNGADRKTLSTRSIPSRLRQPSNGRCCSPISRRSRS